MTTSSVPAVGNSVALAPRTDGLPASRWLGLALLVLGAIGGAFSAIITVDKFKILADPTFVPACTINAVVSCSDVMSSEQSNAFGFPNPLIGLVGFTIVCTTGVIVLAGVTLPRWYWWCSVVGLALATVFVHWLAYQAVYNIAALCPWCMIVWAVTLPLFVMVTVHTVRQSRRQRGLPAASGVVMPTLVVLAWYAGFAVLILEQFVF